MRVYIAGPMEGLQDFNRKAFLDAELEIMHWAEEHGVCRLKVINPAKYSTEYISGNRTYYETMHKCIEELLKADHIWMLEGWESSDGATLEYKIAMALGIKEIHHV